MMMAATSWPSLAMMRNSSRVGRARYLSSGCQHKAPKQTRRVFSVKSPKIAESSYTISAVFDMIPFKEH